MRKSDHKVINQAALRFRELRKERKLTLDAVSFDTGINVARVEYENRNLTLDTIARLCEYYEITLEEFFKDLS